MSKKRTRIQARLEDYGISRRSLRLNDDMVTDEQWLQRNLQVRLPVRNPLNGGRRQIKYVKKHLTMGQREEIIRLRFGALGCCDRICMPMKEIATKLGLIYSTVIRIVRNYVKDGCRIRYLTASRDMTNIRKKLNA